MGADASPVPDFLIVGAMKAGTTTLYRDLCLHPDVHMPAEKEPETLVAFGGDDAGVRRDYASLFRLAPPGAVKGEASTAYTKRPIQDGAADMAARVCGLDLRIIYLRRDPVKRIVSHYKHAVGQGQTDLPFEAAIEADPQYVAISRYDWQIQPWLDLFGEDAVLQLRFEDYIRDRQGMARRVCAHIGVDPDKLPSVNEGAAFNASDNKPVARPGLTRAFYQSRFYLRVAKPLLPQSLRERVREMLPKAQPVEIELTADLASRLTAAVNSAGIDNGA